MEQIAQRVRWFALLAILAGGLWPTLTVDAQDEEGAAEEVAAEELIGSSVKIFAGLQCQLAPAPNNDPMGVPNYESCSASSSGSGTIISPEGRILTNAHVAIPDFPEPDAEPGWLVVALTEDPRQLPRHAFFARAVLYDVVLDLAVIEPVYELDGDPIEPGELTLPRLEMATAEDLAELGLEDSVRVIGYPGVGGSTITVIEAEIAGFEVDPNFEELVPGFLKTSPSSGQGVSGGTTVNPAGKLIGVPTLGSTTALNCADLDTDGAIEPEAGECRAAGGEVGYSRPIPVGFELLQQRGVTGGGGTEEPDAPPPPPDAPQDPGEEPTEPTPPAADAVQVGGTVTDADTGEPIEGVRVFLLRTGLAFDDWDQDDPSAIYTEDVTAGDGRFLFPDPIARGESHVLCAGGAGYPGICFDDEPVEAAEDDDISSLDLPVELSSE